MVNTAVLIGSEHCNSYSLLLCSTPPRPSASRVPFSSSSHMLPGPSTVHLPSPFKKWSTASSRQGASGTRHCGEYSAAALSSIPSSNEQYNLDERFERVCYHREDVVVGAAHAHKHREAHEDDVRECFDVEFLHDIWEAKLDGRMQDFFTNTTHGR